ncbi:MAG: transketolase [Magnetococcales bacterium]|nr:transketolase [Magnetococcales bacterium]
MRHAACSSWINLFRRQNFVFLTGDLGFGALEPLRDEMGQHFINVGIAEQNMVSVAAGMARMGMSAWIYSIAPFCYARPFEQIRNDVCLHGLPVKIVGNGGGYGYGTMGSSHHALEDYGTLLSLPGMRAYVPIFAADVDPMVKKMAQESHPAYLRLGRCERPKEYAIPPYAPWRRLLTGGGTPALVIGPLAGGVIEACWILPEGHRPEIWGLCQLPMTAYPPPQAFIDLVRLRRKLVVIEEHGVHGSAGQMLAHTFLQNNISLDSFVHMHAVGYPSATYGSQSFHRKECGLDKNTLLKILTG